ncbi:enoyl-CoA hydratase domain-containing protein 2, mitochondrial [Nephila pilipes]|uniref:Enoyl-CoA hydratase domain-containing protein 2, mitochondrial n=1 Tax=Nephila pilipes TaxID=299642 RepID=A0A8X6N1T8_NEPPI|nr:enoyl-CoA hydratase domain-containing protein 2, mitochondrial [Nephila pilipes]
MSAPMPILLSNIFKSNVKIRNHLIASFFKRHASSVESRSNSVVLVTKRYPLYLIGINRPEKRNCVNSETASELKKAFENFAEDSQANAAVLYGVGGTFCAGYDLQEISSGNVSLSPDIGPMGPTRMHLRKPVVAAIDGFAVAGGLELALWCDLRIVEETAVLGVFCRRFGVPLIDGGTVRLPKLIGLARALDLILTGRGVNGREAYEMGLVTKLCKKGEGNSLIKLCAFLQWRDSDTSV